MATLATNSLQPLLGRLLRIAIPFGILAAGYVGFARLSLESAPEEVPPAEEQVLRTRVTELRVGDFPVVVTSHSVVQPHNEVVLNAQVAGQIIWISPKFEAGSYFSAGDVLVELDAKDYEIAVALAEATHLGAKSALKLATLNEERKLRLVESNAVSQAEVERASATRAQAEADLESAATQVEQARLDLERTKILAPFDGRVREKKVGLGQRVGSDTTLGDVFAIDFAEVRLPISSRELPFLELPELPGDSPLAVELRDAISDRSDTVWKAMIVRTEGVLDENSRELFAIARIDDPFGRQSGHPPLRIGQPVVASITGEVLTNVVALPRSAVRQLDKVNLVDKTDLTLRPRTIVPLWSDEQHVVVRDPEIEDGMLLATTHLVYAPSGTKVVIIPSGEPATAMAKSNSTSNEPVAN